MAETVSLLFGFGSPSISSKSNSTSFGIFSGLFYMHLPPSSSFCTTRLQTFSYFLVAPSQLYNVSGEQVGPRVWYYDASVQLLHCEHVPFAILSLAILSTYIAILPILLFLYPSKIFQRCLQMCKLKCNVLHAFMDTFQGSYNDGMCDCRYFIAIDYIF